MEYAYALILGAVQGLTEFLPVSSSGHLVILHNFFDIGDIDSLAFDVILHLGTFFALVLAFWENIRGYIAGFFMSFFRPNMRDARQRHAWYILLATIPAAFAGYYLEDNIKEMFRNTFSVAIALIAVSILMFFAERYSKKRSTMEQMTILDAFFVGIAQAIALVPGVSRSGITIITGMQRNLKREDAAKFSFLLSIPIIFGAGVKQSLDMGVPDTSSLGILAVGFFAALVVGYLSIVLFLRFLQNHTLYAFVVYRILLGILLLVFF